MMRSILPAAILLLVSVPQWAAAQEEPTPGPLIPEAEIAILEVKLAQQTAKVSRVKRRRANKSISRKGRALVEKYPTAPNRYRVLGIVLQSQKRLLRLETSDRNRSALYKTCSGLAQAPDEYANLRLEADMVLSEKDLTGRDATLAERAEALREIIARYRYTSAEAKCLMIASLIAQKLGSRQLENEIADVMNERFSDNTEVLAFRRKHLALKAMPLRSRGEFTRTDGTKLFLPADRIGHHCFLVYWSREAFGYERFLKQVEDHRRRYPDMIDFYSFNLDELDDAGEKTLRDLGLDWTVMRLPGGRKHPAFSAFDIPDLLALFINAYGYTRLAPGTFQSDATSGVMSLHTGTFSMGDMRVSHERYLAQMQSLFIGDFLVVDHTGALDLSQPAEMKMVDGRITRTENSVPEEVLAAIQKCFTPPPFRYRMMRTEALADYQRAEKLSADAIVKYPTAPDLWVVRNRRIIALLGMWNISAEPVHLQRAVTEAQAVLAKEPPWGADVVARFCLGKAALRVKEPRPELVLPALVKDAGGAGAPYSAVGAAAILALEGNSRELYDSYRERLLGSPDGGIPALWPLRAFLRNRYHQYRVLKPNYNRNEGPWWRWHIVKHDHDPMTDRLPDVELKTLDGGTLKLPGDTEGKMTLLLFIEPPADPAADFPVVVRKKGFVPKYIYQRNDYIRGVVKTALDMADKHVNKDVNVLLAFLCDDAKQIQSLMKKNKWTCRAAMVPGGLKNPMVNRLGILSADRMPNVFLLRRDGTVVWRVEGLIYKEEFGYPFAVTLGMKVHIEVCELNTAYDALEKGDYKEAARVFSGPYTPWRPQRYGWRPVRHHGWALAYMGLKDWDAALEAVDKAIDAHKLRYFRGRGSRDIKDWRKDAASVVIKETCDTFAELWTVKAIILEQLGRREEAAALRKRAAGPLREDGNSSYKRFHEKLKKLRLAQPAMGRPSQ